MYTTLMVHFVHPFENTPEWRELNDFVAEQIRRSDQHTENDGYKIGLHKLEIKHKGKKYEATYLLDTYPASLGGDGVGIWLNKVEQS